MIILDIDNCIADDGWRIPRINWLREGNERYHEYHTLSPFDTVGNEHLFVGKRAIVLTGRPVAYRAITMEWLARAGVRLEALVMRNDNDHRGSAAVKSTMLDWVFAHYGVAPREIECAYDDRADIVEMYRARGLRAEQRLLHNVCAYTNPLTKEPHP